MVTKNAEHVRWKRKRIIEAKGGACTNCGLRMNLHIHHKDGRGDDAPTSYVQIYENLDKVDVLCEFCHGVLTHTGALPDKRELVDTYRGFVSAYADAIAKLEEEVKRNDI